MINQLKNKLPQWFNDGKKYGMILTDDIDSLASCAALEYTKDYRTEAVMLLKYNYQSAGYQFDQLYDILGATDKDSNIDDFIGIDFARKNGKNIDNHIQKFTCQEPTNQDLINPNYINNNVSQTNYRYKYGGSTLLMVWAALDLPTDNISDEVKGFLLSVDSTFDGQFKDSYIETTRKYLCDVLGLYPLHDFLTCHDRQYFQQIQLKYNLKHYANGKMRETKITASEGKLHTKIDLDGLNRLFKENNLFEIKLPSDTIFKRMRFKNGIADISTQDSIDQIKNKENIYSLAITNKHTCNYSQIIDIY